MNCQVALALAALSVAAATAPLAAAPTTPTRATVTIPLVKTAPKLDGALDDRVWQHATEVGPFVLTTGKRLPAEPTRAWLAFDDSALYVAFQCRESALEPLKQQAHLVKAETRGHDQARLFRDDTVEVFIEPPGRPYFHFAMNPANGRFEQRGLDPKWNGGWNGAAKLGEGEWTAEFVILFESLGVAQPKPGEAWRLNLVRQQKPLREVSSWSGLVGGLHQPGQFGVARFQSGAPLIRELTTTMLPSGELALAATLRNYYPTPRMLLLRGLATSSQNQRLVLLPLTLDGAASPAQPVEVKGELKLPVNELLGDVTVQFALLDAAGAVLDATPGLPIFQASTRVQARVATGGVVELFVNGELRPLSDGRADFALRLGVNVIGLRVAAPESLRWVEGKFQLETIDLTLDDRWRVATTRIDRWAEQRFDDAAWPRARQLGDGRVWAAEAGAGEVYLRRTLVLSDPDEPLWPHANEFVIPRGTSQLLYPLLDPPPQRLRGPVAFHLDLPRGLAFVTHEPLHGATPARVVETSSPRGDDFRRVSLHFEALPTNGAEVSVRYGGPNGDALKTLASLRLGGSFDWRRWEDQVIASDRAYSFQPALTLPTGATGAVWFDDFEVRDALTGKLLFAENFEAEKWQMNPRAVTETRDGKPTRCLKLNAVSSLALTDAPVPIEPGTRLLFRCTARGEDLLAPGRPTRLALLMKCADPAWKSATLFTSFELDDGCVQQVPRTITVTTMAPLAGVRPKQIRLLPCYFNDYFSAPAVLKALADNVEKSGINALYGRRNRVFDSLAPRGVKLVYALEWDPWTAAFDRDLLVRIPEARALNADGQSLGGTVCPTWLLASDCPALSKLHEFITARVRAQRPGEVNWDFEQPTTQPPTFCFCERCRARFAEGAQLAQCPSREQVLGDKSLLAQWTDFRCRQNAQLVALVRAAVKAIDPNLAFSVYSSYQSAYTREHYGVDWSLLTSALDGGIAGYNGTDALLADTRSALGRVPLLGGQIWIETLSVGETGRFDHASWKRRLLRTIIETGGRGVLIWWLPTLSGGAFGEIAELTQFLAAFEDFLVLNQRADALAAVSPSPFPRRNVRVLTRGEERLVVLFNESRDRLTVTLKNLGLPKNAQAAVGGEPRPRARADQLAVTIPPNGFVAVVVGVAKRPSP